jgi:sugar phosphate isomerase/epimerase
VEDTVLAISTCWKSLTAASGDHVLLDILSLGLQAVELEYRVTRQMFEEMLPLIRERSLQVTSIHNFFPLPPGFEPDRASGDMLNLAGDDPEERRRAVTFTMGTMEAAHDLEVKHVVLHMGYVEGFEPLSRIWRRQFGKGEEAARNALKEHLEQRAAFERKALDRAKFSLEKLVRRAEKLGLVLALENRDWPREIPNLEEMADLLSTFDGAALGFWFDTGHAFKQEFFGLAQALEWVRRFGSRMIGTHLHDLKGIKDHLPPGKGDLDFAKILKEINETKIWVLEIDAEFTAEEIRQGIQYLLSYKQ